MDALVDQVVLVVSNNETERVVLNDYLKKLRAGATIKVASLEEAIQQMRGDACQAIIMREELDSGYGHQFLKFINDRPESFKSLRFKMVYVTEARQSNLEKIAMQRPDAILAWPFSLNDLKSRIESAFSNAA